MTFRTTQSVLGAEKAFKGKGYTIEVIPIPRGITSDCGFCIKMVALVEAVLTSEIIALAAQFSFESAWVETIVDAAVDRRMGKKYERIG